VKIKCITMSSNPTVNNTVYSEDTLKKIVELINTSDEKIPLRLGMASKENRGELSHAEYDNGHVVVTALVTDAYVQNTLSETRMPTMSMAGSFQGEVTEIDELKIVEVDSVESFNIITLATHSDKHATGLISADEEPENG